MPRGIISDPQKKFPVVIVDLFRLGGPIEVNGEEVSSIDLLPSETENIIPGLAAFHPSEFSVLCEHCLW